MFAMREIDVVVDLERKLFLYLGVVLLAIGVGPFGTYEAMTIWERTVFWTLDIMVGMAIIAGVLHVFYYSRLAALIPSYPRFFLGIVLGALPGVAFVTVLYGTIGNDLEISTPFPLLYVQVTIFSTVLLLTEFLLWPAVVGTSSKPTPARPSSAPEKTDVPRSSEPTALLSRLPPEHRDSEIISISMQDHYAEVSTTTGQALILMRLGDAVDLLEGYPGVRVHRSHCVATKFVEKTEKIGRRLEVVLSDGRHLPIGNTYIKAVHDQIL